LAALLPWVPPVLAAPRFNLLRALLFAAALLPLARLLALAATGGLGANPVEFVIRSLGTWTLVCLCVTLSITPLRWISGWAWPLRLRRMFGLFCFFYASLHLLAFAGLDQWFDGAALWTEVVKRPFITLGFAAFVLLIPLAVTSTNGMIRRLGGKNWQRLHRLVYAVAVLAILHYVWHKAGKNDFGTVSVYGAVIGVLLGARVVHWARGRRNVKGAARAVVR
jgi:sulfoxide reductase heme-binding subunit YedZ